ncbi:TlpA disulfide reductase family protein [Pedobacter deserti]|uniref:TlpA disulfide reductase family protein n=1 Tax=Pedobacter deserti TaxID=2817382 RepID=UPI00210A7BCC|nr:TlpA disulfide reductase family protein [Pedobacter sp. SYSU D00382]
MLTSLKSVSNAVALVYLLISEIGVKVSFVAILVLPGVVFSQGVASITGKATKLKDGAQLIFTEFDPSNLDSPRTYTLTVGSGSFKGDISTGHGDMFTLKMDKESHRLYLAPGPISIELPDSTLKTIKIDGSQPYVDFLNRDSARMSQPFYQTLRTAYREVSNGKDPDSPEILRKLDSINFIYKENLAKFELRWLQTSTSGINTRLLYDNLTRLSGREVQEYFSRIEKNAQDNNCGRYIKFRLDSLSINSVAPEFVLQDTAKNEHHLTSYRGKYVLLDFWASWCVPCRAENPALRALYQKYKGGNFEIIGVSLDSDRASWIKAIGDDDLPWVHLSDLQGWKNKVSRKYQIRSIPSNVLISPEGRIIATNLKVSDLEDELKKRFNQVGQTKQFSHDLSSDDTTYLLIANGIITD